MASENRSAQLYETRPSEEASTGPPVPRPKQSQPSPSVTYPAYEAPVVPLLVECADVIVGDGQVAGAALGREHVEVA